MLRSRGDLLGQTEIRVSVLGRSAWVLRVAPPSWNAFIYFLSGIIFSFAVRSSSSEKLRLTQPSEWDALSVPYSSPSGP